MDHYLRPLGDGPDQGDYEPSPYFTEPAETVPPTDHSSTPQVPQADPWVTATFFVVALLAIVGGIAMRRRSRSLNGAHQGKRSYRW